MGGKSRGERTDFLAENNSLESKVFGGVEVVEGERKLLGILFRDRRSF